MTERPREEEVTYAGRYRRIRRIGAGGMANVYLAEDEVLGREVAIKLIHSASPEDMLKRFRREAKLGASVNHPNLVAVYDSVTEDDALLIVMEYVEGDSLSQRLRGRRLSEDDALDVLDQVAAAIDNLHQHSVIHRDIKPSNILIRKDGLVKVADLGIATATDMTSITASSAVIGSLPYMAPERLRGAEIDGACDIFSLGAVAFEMLAGHRMHDSATPEEQINLASSDSVPDVKKAWPDAPPPAARVIAQAMNPEPGSRQFSAAAFMADLRGSLTIGEETETATAPMPATVTAPLPTGHEPSRKQRPPEPFLPPPPPPQLPKPPGPPGPLPPPRAPGGRRGSLMALVAAAIVVAGIAFAATRGGDDEKEPSRSAGSNQGKQNSGDSTTAQEVATTPTPDPEPQPAAPTVDPVALNDQGKALIDSGDPAGAIPLLEQAVDLYEPGTEDQTYYYALFNLGNALRLAGRPAEAIPYLEERLTYDDQTEVVQAELDLARQEAGLAEAPSDSEDASGGVTPPDGGVDDEEKPGKGPKPGKVPKDPKDPGGGVGPG